MNSNLGNPKSVEQQTQIKQIPNIDSMEDDSDQHSGARIGSNEDLLTEVFIRLPVTSILRFKTVSKRWRLLLSHKHFTHRYDNNNNLSKSVGLIDLDIYVPYDVENRSPPPFRSLDFHFNRSNVIIEQSCNGLLLCSAYHNWDFEYYVFNPTTKQLAFIPSLPKNIRSIALAYDQTLCVHYKVICIRASELVKKLFQIQVYSSDTAKWKICAESLSVQNPSFDQPVYWNGAVYWEPDFWSRNSYMYFKLDVEQLQTSYVQGDLMSNQSKMYFGESIGHLHYITLTHREPNSLIVYEMLMDHSGWFVKYRVQFDELLGALSKMVDQDCYYFDVIDVVRGKEEEDTFLVLVIPMKMIVRYNVHDKSFKELCCSHTNNTLMFSNFYRYIEILSSF